MLHDAFYHEGQYNKIKYTIKGNVIQEISSGLTNQGAKQGTVPRSALGCRNEEPSPGSYMLRAVVSDHQRQFFGTGNRPLFRSGPFALKQQRQIHAESRSCCDDSCSIRDCLIQAETLFCNQNIGYTDGSHKNRRQGSEQGAKGVPAFFQKVRRRNPQGDHCQSLIAP